MGYDFEKTLFVTTAKYGVSVDNYIVMPNHVHLLLTFDNNWNALQSVNENGRAWKPAPTRSTNKIGACGNPPLQKLIGEIKSYTTKLYREREKDVSLILWQRSFYEHIIRNETDFQNTWNYIEYNALKEYGK